MLRRSLVASAVVGTVLTLLNQGDAIILGQMTVALAWKIPLTYCVPFLVATYGALSNSRDQGVSPSHPPLRRKPE